MSRSISNSVFLFPLCLCIYCTSFSQSSMESERKFLRAKKDTIISFILQTGCLEKEECFFIGFGSKPCGGPWEYLTYSSQIDTLVFFAMIKNYNLSEDSFNKRWGIVSDCSIPNPPDSIRCIDGQCTGYYYGIPKFLQAP